MANLIDLERYARHFPVIGLEGQKRLKQSKVMIVGVGGLGCPVLSYLVASGVGEIGLIDGDNIELSNLQRQVIFTEVDVGLNKAKKAESIAKAMNSQLSIHAHPVFLTDENALALLSGYDVIVDATDNYPARYLINRISRAFGIPLVSASLFQFDGQLSVFNYKAGPCYECLYPQAPPDDLIPNCAEGGVLGVLPGVMGTLQAMEVLKVLLSLGDVLSGRFLRVDLLSSTFKSYPIAKQQHCTKAQCTQLKSQNNTPPTLKEAKTIQAQTLAKALKDVPNAYFLLDVREPFEREICHIGGELIPLSSVETHYTQLPKDKIIVVYCKKGARSAKAAAFLLDKGFDNVLSLAGGILSWCDDVDPDLSKY